MFLVQELIWLAIGVALAVIRQLAFADGRSTLRVVAIGAVAAWCGGAATLLVTREPSSTLAVFMAGVLAVVALSIDAVVSRRTHRRRRS